MYSRKFLKYFLKLVREVSLLSTCYKKQVGAIIVKDRRILATGYNGTPSNMIECLELTKFLEFLHANIPKDEILKTLKNFMYTFDANVFSNYSKDISIIETLLYKYPLEHLQRIFKTLYTYIEKDIDSYEMYSPNELIARWNFIHNKYEIHAEINAITQCVKYGIPIEGADIFVTHLPCIDCAKAIIASGIKRVFYIQYYKDKKWNEDSLELFKLNKVQVFDYKTLLDEEN